MPPAYLFQLTSGDEQKPAMLYQDCKEGFALILGCLDSLTRTIAESVKVDYYRWVMELALSRLESLSVHVMMMEDRSVICASCDEAARSSAYLVVPTLSSRVGIPQFRENASLLIINSPPYLF